MRERIPRSARGTPEQVPKTTSVNAHIDRLLHSPQFLRETKAREDEIAREKAEEIERRRLAIAKARAELREKEEEDLRLAHAEHLARERAAASDTSHLPESARTLWQKLRSK